MNDSRFTHSATTSHVSLSPVASSTVYQPTPQDLARRAAYDGFLERIQHHYDSFFANIPHPPVAFTTDTTRLESIYLTSLGGDHQYYRCHACAAFLRKYGGLVTIQDGVTTPVFWGPHPLGKAIESPLDGTVYALWEAVSQAPVTGVFVLGKHREESKLGSLLLGTPGNNHKTKGSFSHMAVKASRWDIDLRVTVGEFVRIDRIDRYE